MDTADVRLLLEAVASGTVEPHEALTRITAGPLGDGNGWTDLGYARVDTHRGLRTGDAEVVYAAGKTPAQTVGIVAELRRASGAGHPTLVTRADAATVTALLARWPGELTTSGIPALDPSSTPDPGSRPAARLATVVVGPLPPERGQVVVVSAGTSDAPVAAEAALTARASGAGVETITDVGVAGLHRILAVRDVLAAADCLIVIAGMEGALPSVVGGLVGTPVIAVPTSIGYGASFGGLAALLGMLNSCAPGVVVCNIDNGFGAGIFAARITRRTRRATARPTVADSGQEPGGERIG
ncbi:nickel pincer cofactor biosynthesis protein LarB [Frankia sp. CiP3]|uniref:nickel pincer cofactor biosynthesis protein LarB n=1 Tax=Frankia sp. CiP3 TaxID=2880971 RepID=UPI001EF6981F|nr:nickel pincer cofactor biosynthesis protein LarB [Frankia sp. CiP3]